MSTRSHPSPSPTHAKRTQQPKRRREVGGIAVDEGERWRTENLGRLLLEALNACQRKVLAGLHARGFRSARQVHLNVIRHVDRQGTRMTDLAARMGITNGATTQAVETCVADGLVEVLVDPDDKRVRRVGFTAKGIRFLSVVHARYNLIEREARDALGERGVARLRESLLVLREPDADASAPSS